MTERRHELTDEHGKPLSWWWSTDEERFRGPCDSRLDAIVEAFGDDNTTFCVLQAEHAPLNCDLMDGGELAERFDDQNEEAADGDGDPISSELPDAAWSELSDTLRVTLKALVRKHGAKAWTFSRQGEAEWVTVADPMISALPEEARKIIAEIAHSWAGDYPWADSYLDGEIQRLRIALSKPVAPSEVLAIVDGKEERS